jgi:hypothetical protein
MLQNATFVRGGRRRRRQIDGDLCDFETRWRVEDEERQ